MEIKRGYEIGKQDGHSFILNRCLGCGKDRWIRYDNPAPAYCKDCFYKNSRSKEWRLKLGLSHKGKIREQSPCWKGGRIDNRGYTLLKLKADDPYFSMIDKHGYVAEHRYMMAQHLGRCLTSDEIVHHLDGIKTHNEITNLKLTVSGRHPLAYADAYRQGYQDGQAQKISSLESKIDRLIGLNRLLLWHVTQNKIEVNNAQIK